ncbi:hypothetical protein BO85DRAFT_99489 [Aspergillus piperis CBS 112811]|uniref:Uncharacterized protein n=1 Tax=Aspergillus piperis CBS 112811 TaxID=1448313 RepID=A0A8G1QXF7_9EURO|nr:hypothetical protein BO85DRAFT_99489 [Aspergillus piperis CBS 112811]RAH54766.1 hypothetical protein BO85DRAFT_99489 [Aspergillus piperis CBS 112811]
MVRGACDLFYESILAYFGSILMYLTFDVCCMQLMIVMIPYDCLFYTWTYILLLMFSSLPSLKSAISAMKRMVISGGVFFFYSCSSQLLGF